MGKLGKEKRALDHPPIARQTHEQASAQDEGPDSDALRVARSRMSTPKFAVIGGHTGIVFLTNYDVADGTYAGEFHRNVSMNAGDDMPAVKQVVGLRPYPYAERPDYEFQFVECGDDTSVLRNLQRHAQARDTEVVETQE